MTGKMPEMIEQPKPVKGELVKIPERIPGTQRHIHQIVWITIVIDSTVIFQFTGLQADEAKSLFRQLQKTSRPEFGSMFMYGWFNGDMNYGVTLEKHRWNVEEEEF